VHARRQLEADLDAIMGLSDDEGDRDQEELRQGFQSGEPSSYVMESSNDRPSGEADRALAARSSSEELVDTRTWAKAKLGANVDTRADFSLGSGSDNFLGLSDTGSISGASLRTKGASTTDDQDADGGLDELEGTSGAIRIAGTKNTLEQDLRQGVKLSLTLKEVAATSRMGYAAAVMSKVNQDRGLAEWGFFVPSPNQKSTGVNRQYTDVSILGVMDGHGKNGHTIAAFVQFYLLFELLMGPHTHTITPALAYRILEDRSNTRLCRLRIDPTQLVQLKQRFRGASSQGDLIYDTATRAFLFALEPTATFGTPPVAQAISVREHNMARTQYETLPIRPDFRVHSGTLRPTTLPSPSTSAFSNRNGAGFGNGSGNGQHSGNGSETRRSVSTPVFTTLESPNGVTSNAGMESDVSLDETKVLPEVQDDSDASGVPPYENDAEGEHPFAITPTSTRSPAASGLSSSGTSRSHDATPTVEDLDAKRLNERPAAASNLLSRPDFQSTGPSASQQQYDAFSPVVPSMQSPQQHEVVALRRNPTALGAGMTSLTSPRYKSVSDGVALFSSTGTLSNLPRNDNESDTKLVPASDLTVAVGNDFQRTISTAETLVGDMADVVAQAELDWERSQELNPAGSTALLRSVARAIVELQDRHSPPLRTGAIDLSAFPGLDYIARNPERALRRALTRVSVVLRQLNDASSSLLPAMSSASSTQSTAAANSDEREPPSAQFGNLARKFDAYHSGTTTCVVLQVGSMLYIANIGDSRCLVIRRKDVACPHLPPFPTQAQTSPSVSHTTQAESGDPSEKDIPLDTSVIVDGNGIGGESAPLADEDFDMFSQDVAEAKPVTKSNSNPVFIPTTEIAVPPYEAKQRMVSTVEIEAIPLTRDHKPDLPSERERILKTGARIVENATFPGVFRVYRPDANTPGISVARSYGDLASRSLGLSDEPEIVQYQLCPSDLVLVIASDGLWEFVSNDEVADILVHNIDNLKHGLEVLIATARSRYLTKTHHEYIDDTTVVVAVLSDNFAAQPAQSLSESDTIASTSPTLSVGIDSKRDERSDTANNSESGNDHEREESESTEEYGFKRLKDVF